jgi:hypothetical protein
MESETFFDAVNAKHFEDRQFVTDVSIEHDVKSRESLVPVFELHGREFELVVDHREDARRLFGGGTAGLRHPSSR